MTVRVLRKRTAVFAAFLTLSSMSLAEATPQKTVRSLTARQIASDLLPSVAVVLTSDSQGRALALGSAFAVEKGLFVTNYHVVRDASTVEVRLTGEGNTARQARVVLVNSKADLALLSAPDLKAKPLTLVADSSVAVGDTIYAIGNPKGFEGTFSQGIVTALRRDGDVELIQIQAPISPGSSGGPVVNSRGSVVGVATATFSDGQALNFAVSALHVANLLASFRDSPTDGVARQSRVLGPRDVSSPSDSPTAEDFLRLGFEQMRPEKGGITNADLDKAIAYFESATSLAPQNNVAWTQLCTAQLMRQHYGRAVESGKRALALKPNDAFVLLQVCSALLGDDRPLDALEFAKQAIRVAPDDAVAHEYAARCFKTLNRADEALSEYRIAVKLAPEWWWLWSDIGDLYLSRPGHRSNLEQAEAAFRECIRIKPSDARGHYGYGWVLAVTGRKQAALDEYKMLLGIDRELADSLFDAIYR